MLLCFLLLKFDSAENAIAQALAITNFQCLTDTIPELKAQAETGDVDSQLCLASRYFLGTEGVTQDPIEAAKWFKKCAEAGNVYAEYWLGLMYSSGEGVAKDPIEAAKWFKKCAEAGDARGQYYLARAFLKGIGVPKDPLEALKWFKKSAEAGLTNAQVALGIMYEDGIGIPIDKVEAFKLYKKSAEAGDHNAQTFLGGIYESGNGVPRNIVDALAWTYIAAGKGDAFARKQSNSFEKLYGMDLSVKAQERAMELSRTITPGWTLPE